MQIFRQYLLPLFTILICLFALIVVTARSFLDSDLAAPAPTEEIEFLGFNYSVNYLINH